MRFKYDLHQHTAPCSGCGRANPEQLVRTMKAEGFAGCVLTDHFYHGNTGIDRKLPWRDFCDPYVENYLEAKAVGDEIDFDVIFGIEEGVGGGKEVLLYGITPEFLYSNPELRNADLPLIHRLAHEVGALVIQAHPFRNRPYIPDPLAKLPPQYLDGYEVWNSGSTPEDNQRAVQAFKANETIITAGSDCHHNHADVRSYVESRKRIRYPEILVEVLKHGDYEIRKDIAIEAMPGIE